MSEETRFVLSDRMMDTDVHPDVSRVLHQIQIHGRLIRIPVKIDGKEIVSAFIPRHIKETCRAVDSAEIRGIFLGIDRIAPVSQTVAVKAPVGGQSRAEAVHGLLCADQIIKNLIVIKGLCFTIRSDGELDFAGRHVIFIREGGEVPILDLSFKRVDVHVAAIFSIAGIPANVEAVREKPPIPCAAALVSLDLDDLIRLPLKYRVRRQKTELAPLRKLLLRDLFRRLGCRDRIVGRIGRDAAMPSESINTAAMAKATSRFARIGTVLVVLKYCFPAMMTSSS